MIRFIWCLPTLILLFLSSAANAEQSWITVSETIKHRSEATLLEHNNEVYLFNGFTFGIKIQNSVEKYNPKTNQWTLLSSTSTVSSLATAVTHNGAVVVGDEAWLIGAA